MATGTFTTDEKDRLFQQLDAIHLDVRKLREGRIRDLNRISSVEKAVKALQAVPMARAARWHTHASQFFYGLGGAVFGFLGAHGLPHL